MSQIDPALTTKIRKIPKAIPNWLFISLVAFTATGLIIGGLLFYTNQAQAIHDQKANELKSIAALKVQQIVQWRQERLTDAQMNSDDPLLDQAIGQWLANPDDAATRTVLTNRLQRIVDLEGYQNVFVTNADGSLLHSLDPGMTSLDAETQQLAGQAFSSQKIIMGDLIRNPVSGKVTLNVAAPVPNSQNKPVVGLVCQINPETYLYPLIQSWPVPSQSAETLLFRKDGADILFLNTLRFRADPPLTIRIPLTQAGLSSVQAGLGRTGVIEGRDYRGVKVLAEILPVPDTTWFMEAKVDSGEILAEISALGLAVLIVVFLAVLMATTLVAYVFNTHQRLLYKNLFQAERERREAQEETRTTLYSIGDGVITTDAQGIVTRLNPIAEKLTGWSEAEAFGKPLAQVFHIISEVTRQRVENPVERVLHESRIIDMANHTLLVDRKGGERPIADSSAPIWDAAGHITGVVLVFRDQSQERAAQKERALLNYTIANSLNEIYLFDANTYQLRYVNEGAEKNLGYSQEQLLTMTPLNIKPEFTLESFQILVRPLEEGRIPVLIFDTVHQRANGSRYPVEVHLQLFEYDGERVFLAVIDDITERKHVEENLRESEDKFKYVFDNSIVGKSITHLSGEIQVNRAFCEMLDYSPVELQGEKWQHITHPDDVEMTQKEVNALLSGEKTGAIFSKRFLRKNGSVVWADVSSSLRRDKEGKPLYLMTTLVDITERKRAEEMLRASQERYRLISTVSSDYMFSSMLDASGKLTLNWVAGAFEAITGYAYEEYVAHGGWRAALHPGDLAVDDRDIEKLRTNQPVISEVRTITKTGKVIWVRVYAHPVFDLERKELIGIYGAVQDISERKQAELALRKSEERYRALFHNNHTVMLLLDPENGAVVDANTAAARFYGWSVEELTHKKISEINLLSEAEINREIQLARREQRSYFLFRHRKKNGQVRDVEVFSGPIQLVQKEYLYSIVHDITDRKLAEAKVAEQLGELQQWHTATLGREMRVLELKEEVNEVLIQAGLPPRYVNPEIGAAHE